MSRWKRMMAAVTGGGGRNPMDDKWWSDAPSRLGLQVAVNADTVIGIPEAYACLQVIAQTIAALPLHVYVRQGAKGKAAEPRHPLYDILHHRASNTHTAYEFRHQMTWDLCLHRNAFAEIIDGRRGFVDQLVRLDPETVVVRTLPDNDWLYEVPDGNGGRRKLLREQVFHLRAPPMISSNILGRSLIVDNAQTFARAIALQDYANRFFANDATPGGVVEMTGKFANLEQAKEFQEKWRQNFSGQNRHKVAFLDGGATFKTIDVQNDKAQFLDTYKEVALQVVRIWRMPPHKVGILDRATFSNIESQALEFVADTLLPWVVAWEQGIARDLIARPDTFIAEHNLAGLLRGDIKSRYEAYRIAREWGWMSADDVRALENMNPLGAGRGDVYLQPMNMVPAGTPAPQRTAAPNQSAVEHEITVALDTIKLLEGAT